MKCTNLNEESLDFMKSKGLPFDCYNNYNSFKFIIIIVPNKKLERADGIPIKIKTNNKLQYHKQY